MERVLAVEGDPDAHGIVLVVEPRKTPREAPPSPWADDHLDQSRFVRKARRAALADPAPRPISVTVDGEAVELASQDGTGIRDFVRTVYLLHGWWAVEAVEEELTLMVELRERPDVVAAKTDDAVSALSGGTMLPAVDGGANEAASRSRRTPDQQALRDRYEELRLRTALVTTEEIRHCQMSVEATARGLRGEVLTKLRALEEQAFAEAVDRFNRARETVVQQVLRYYHWRSPSSAAFALDARTTGEIQIAREPIKDLQRRLDVLIPAASSAVACRARADELMSRSASSSGYLTDAGDRLPAALEAAKSAEADYAVALVVEAAEHPVLFRFTAATVMHTVEHSDPKTLGTTLWTRLRSTWLAAQTMASMFEAHRPASRLDEMAVLATGMAPEEEIARHAKDSVWSFPRLIEAVLAESPPEESRVARAAFARVLDAHRGDEESAAAGAIGGLGLAAFTLALTSVCPPAGMALDMALSAADVSSTAAEYGKLSAAARSDLDPRESLAEADPSAVPFIFAVAAAAMVAR